jgi:putative ABC transport system permease protein
MGLRHARTQLALAAVAMAVAVSLPVILLSVGGGVAQHELDALESSGYQISISAAGTHGISGAHAMVRAIGAMEHVDAVSPVLSVALEMYWDGQGPVPVLVEGIIPQAFSTTVSPEEVGLFPQPLGLGDPTDLLHFDNGSYDGPSAGRILLSSPIADAHDLRVGSSIQLASSEGTERIAYNVSGVFGLPPTLLGPTGAFAALLPLSDLQQLSGYGRGGTGALLDSADTVQVALEGSAATDPGTVDRLAATIQAAYPYYVVDTLTDTVQQAEGATSILNGFYLALSSVSLVVGLLFLALVLVRRVETRRPTIAIRRAIGMPARMIAGELAGEALLLSGVGVVGGLAMGYAVVEALAYRASGTVQEAARLAVFAPETLATLSAAVLGLGLLASGAATRAALRMNITEVLR